MFYSRSTDWKCHCGTNNFGSRTKCFRCDDFKSKTTKIPRNKNDWECASCQEINFAARTNCRKCSTARNVYTNNNSTINPPTITVTESLNLIRPGDWKCTRCGSTELNFGSRSNCRTCGAAKISQSINQSINQPNTQSINQPFNQPFNQSINQSINQPFNQSSNQPFNSPLNQSTTQSSNECKICYDRPISVAFTPCGHIVSCNVCCYAMNKCPICKKPYTEDQIMTIYLG